MNWIRSVIAAGLVFLACGEGQAQEGPGIAAKYPGDAGIGKDPQVVFAEDFEAWEPNADKPPAQTWDLATEQLAAVPGAVLSGGKEIPGKQVLVTWAFAKGRTSVGLEKHLGNYLHAKEGKGPGYDEIYLRYYQKFDSDYTPVGNHGANLGGRDVTRRSSWVGKSGIRDVAKHGYFYSGLQPHNWKNGKMWWALYSYHMDKKDAWGDDYDQTNPEKRYIETNRWYCLERHMKLNSADPTKRDGVEELWVDGELVLRRDGLRFRDASTLKINFFALQVYYHKLPDTYPREHPIKVYFDHLVIAKERIGPIAAP
jgi:hypothetical protein